MGVGEKTELLAGFRIKQTDQARRLRDIIMVVASKR